MRNVETKNIEFRLLLVGNENATGEGFGPISEKIDAISKKYNLGDWIIKTGRVSFDVVPDYYSLIDIAPFPRKPQPVTEIVSPMKPLEAMAMQKAVVVSSVAALAEMIENDENGLMFDKGDINALSTVLQKLIENPDLRSELGVNARSYVEENRTWKHAVAKIQDKVSFYSD